MAKIAINGLGRIGRGTFRALLDTLPFFDMELVAVNSGAPMDTSLHLLKYDSVHGGTLAAIERKSDHSFQADSFENILYLQEKDPKKLPWKQLGVDLVFECTGTFNERDLAAQHLTAGAKKVIVSAPCKSADATIVFGVNNHTLKSEHQVISIGSCTTNCLAPIVNILHKEFGIISGFMTTIHAYTNDQNLLDNSHKDLRRARSAPLSMIPTSTGAAKTIGLIIPELSGKLDGVAVRVPVPNVSMIDLTCNLGKKVTVDGINAAMQAASEREELADILDISPPDLVSIDYNGAIFSAIFDPSQTRVVGDSFCRVVAWYDNETGFAYRMLDVADMWLQI